MHIVVCLKQVVDPEIPAEHFEIDPDTNRPDEDSSDMVIDTYAEHALETAIQIRDKMENAKVTAICIGDDESEDVLRKALSFTADEAIRVWDDELEDVDLDGQAVGHILAKTIEHIGGADLVLTGYQASDIEEGLVGPVIAEEIKASCVTFVSDVKVEEGDKINVKSEAENGSEIIEVSSPSVLTITSSEANVPRLPKVKDVRLARKKSIEELELEDLGLVDESNYQSTVTLERVFIPERNVDCTMIDGDSSEEIAGNLVNELVKEKVL